MIRKTLLILAVGILFPCISFSRNFNTLSNPVIIYVPTDFPTVQAAINNADEGCTIFVHEGVYNENVVVNKTVSLLGENKEKTMIDGGDSGMTVSILAENVSVKNFTIQGGGSNAYESGIFVGAFHGNVTDNIIVENSLFGICLNYSINTLVSANVIRQNKGDGIVLYNSYNNTFVDNTLTGNKIGLHLHSSDQNNISSNTLQENRLGGVGLVYSSGNWITNNSILRNTGNGIILDYSSDNNMLTGNTITATVGYGLMLASSSGNILRNNSMSTNTFDFYCPAIRPSLSDFLNDIDDSNVINSQPVYYIVNEKGLLIDQSTFTEIGYLALINCTDMKVQNISLSQNGQGLLLAFTNSSIIENFKAAKNNYGMQLLYCFNNTIANSAFTDNSEDGITVDHSSTRNSFLHNTLENNHYAMRLIHSTNENYIADSLLTNNTIGIWMYSYCDYNTIASNMLTNNSIGISMARACTNSTIIRNLLSNNTAGIRLDYCSNNTIYGNDFTNNTINVVSSNSTNTWNSNYPTGGNYWSNYVDMDQYSGLYQNETGSDGIWDHPYVIDESNKDNYPIIPEFSSLIIVPLFIIPSVLIARARKRISRPIIT